FGVMSSNTAAREYSNDLIFLFLGGFFLALTLERWNIHRRMALRIMASFGTKLPRTVLGVMCAVALLSMWISNTATTLMMLPICLALVDQVREQTDDEELSRRFALCLLLGCAYAANVGGMGTPIGTAPNGIFQQRFAELGMAPSFAQWMAYGVPLVVVMVGMIWFLLVRVLQPLPRTGDAIAGELIRERLQGLGRMGREEFGVLSVFGLAVVLWVTREDIGPIPGWTSGLRALGLDWIQSGAGSGVGDSVVSIGAMLLLCMIRVRRGGEPLADWRLALKVPWGMLLLFGGGFAIAQGFRSTSGVGLSLSEWVGHGLEGIGSIHPVLLIAATCFVLSFLTELTSNTATTAVTIPILSTIGDLDSARLLCLAATLSASCAFMFPVATPPNAIVFASGRVPIRSMMATGFAFNLIGVVVVTIVVWGIARFSLP
ncbi:MAG: anion permease, partial [Planctomycetes bacterium]|nr:anion permease [Planctomycetota bacterium]